MNVKLRVLSAGALFFIGGAMLQAQETKKDSIKDIEEVVVVAYGTQKKEAIVGSVSTVDSRTLATQQATNPLTALQGTIAGVNLISDSGQPGDTPNIYIRGVSSINASTQPLIILDGSPFNGTMGMIPQEQIESMSVLKDASATVLYGSRAANGVIIITTKKGRRNSKARVTLTSLAGVSTPAVKLYETLGAEDFMKYSWQAIRNNQVYNNGLTQSAAGAYATNNLISILGYNPYDVDNPIDENGSVVPGANLLWDTNWEDALINQAAFKQEHRLGISGGSANTTYFFGADYLDMDGNVKTSNFERVGFRSNIDSKVNDWLEVGFNTAYTTSHSTFPTQSGTSYSSAIQWIYTIPNIYPLYQRDENGALVLDELGNYIYDYGQNESQLVNGTRPGLSNENAVGALYNYDYTRKKNYYVANGYVQLSFTKDLKLRSQASYENQLTDNYDYISSQYGYAESVGGRVAQVKATGKTINWFNSLSYDKSFGNHNVYAQALFEIMDYKYDYLAAQGTGFLPGVGVLNGATTPESVRGYIAQERLVSYMGRFTYNYGGKYFLESSFRTDGSSRFGSENRWGNFWSVGGSWVLSREEFMKGSFISNLKLKGSYGELGNNKTLDSNGAPLYFPAVQGFEV
ncbi:MAG: SusC/RagA family TonB-linked outer membrane protein, partial [Xanthomarina gelatinilytica]|uniref:SusC/RagA family TonB-linked outer membrane protein n=1 Tax=Xanthomarina gelatinilytica TaxID=1137281 RepID=UPI003A893AAF